MTRYIGSRVARIEGVEKVTGAARYAAEHELPDMHHAAILGATISAGRIVRIDTSAAEAVAGTVAIIDHRSMPALQSVRIFPFGPAGEGSLPLQSDRVAYAGQAVALTVATSQHAAAEAAALIDVTYEADPPRSMAERLDAGETGEVPIEALQRTTDASRGSATAGLATADTVVESTYDTAGHAHNALELAATVASWNEAAQRLSIYESTQWLLGVRRAVADALQLSFDQVEVFCPYTGGGFGSKCFVWPHTFLAAVATRRINAPVRIVLTRAQTLTAFGCRPQTRQTIALGAASDGRLSLIRHFAIEQTSVMDCFLRPAGEVSETLYAVPNLETRHLVLPVHSTTPTNMRAPAESFGSFALESAFDELAYALRIDPLALRRTNYAHEHPSGLPWSSCALDRCYDEGAAAFGWERRPLEPRTMTSGNGTLGWGMAAGCYGAYRSQAAVRASRLADGTFEIACATHEIGSGTKTLMAMIAAETLDVPIDRVRIVLGDASLPAASVHGASRAASSVGPAVAEASRKLREHLRDAPAQTTVTVQARSGPPELTDADFTTLASGLNTIRQPKTDAAALYAFVAHFVEVEVREDAGRARIRRVVTRVDAGRIVNPMSAHSQIMGGIVMGIGMAFHEAIVWDRHTARQTSASPTEYHIASLQDMPDELDIAFVEAVDPITNEFGMKGVGEVGLVGFAAAIANALWHATGRRFRRLPITTADLLAARPVEA